MVGRYYQRGMVSERAVRGRRGALAQIRADELLNGSVHTPNPATS
jgi:hypothetical protein